MPRRADSFDGFDLADCDECGNRAVQRVTIDGVFVDECTYCDALFGDPAAVERLETAREAELLGIDVRVYPLCKLLDAVRGLRTHEANAGSRSQGIAPFIKFRLSGDVDALRVLDRLLTSLTLVNKRTKAIWHYEVGYERGVIFEFKPKFPKHAVPDAAYIQRCRDDLPIIADAMKAHALLSWWDI